MAYYTLLREYSIYIVQKSNCSNAVDHITGTTLIIWPNSGPWGKCLCEDKKTFWMHF